MLPLVRESGNQVLKAEAAVFLGMTWGAQGKFGRAREILPPALPVLERAQALPEWLRGNGWPALAQSQSGECAAELAQAQRALARVLELRNPHEISLAHFYLASVFRFGGEVEQSIVEGQAAIAAAEPAGDNYLLYVGYVALAWAESQSGQHEAGRRSLEQAKRLMAGMGGRLGVADWEKPAY